MTAWTCSLLQVKQNSLRKRPCMERPQEQKQQLNRKKAILTGPSLLSNTNSTISRSLEHSTSKTVISRPQWQSKAVLNAHGQFSTPMHSTIWTTCMQKYASLKSKLPNLLLQLDISLPALLWTIKEARSLRKSQRKWQKIQSITKRKAQQMTGNHARQ